MQTDGTLHSASLWLLIFITLLGFSTISHAAERPNKSQYGGEYRAPLVSEPATLDPAYYTDIYSMNVAANLFDGLVEFDQNLKVVPAIARRWKISRDHRTYTFLLRKGVKFHNGREVTAEDFIFSFSRILNPHTQSPVASFFLNIRGANTYHEGNSPTVSGLSASDPYTLKIELEQPFAPFLSILAMVNAKVVPQEAIGPEFGKHPVGTGPFQFGTWNAGQEIVLKANKHYFAGPPFLDKLHFRIYLNIEWEQIFEDFKKGLLEHALIPSQQYDTILADAEHAYTVITKPGLNLVYVGMNMHVPPFNDLRVRQAVNYAVDTQAIVKNITKRGSTPAQGILPPGIAGFDPNFPGYSYDPQKARQLLAEAGFPEGREFPPIEIWTVSKAESVQRELQAYQRYLAEIGLQTSLRVAADWKEFIQVISESKAAMFYAAWYADYPDPDNFFYPLTYSTSKTNRMGFYDPQVDQLLDQARAEMDYLKRAELYRDIETLVMHSAPIVSQHVNSDNYLLQAWVRGAELSHLGASYLPFRNVWFEQQRLAAGTPDKVTPAVNIATTQ